MISKRFSFKLLIFSFLLVLNLSFAQQIIINEVMSSNTSVITDEDNSYQDWIEIYNQGNTSVNLSGYGLTDDETLPYKWVFPNVSIESNQYIIIWASDKNRAVVGEPLHTNFKISSDGEKIVLTNSNGVTVDFSPSIALAENVSYGRQPNATGSWLFFYEPTPGQANTGSGLSSLLTPPTFSHTSGLYTQNFNLNITHTNSQATIVYTLDGSEPDINNLNGTTYQYKNDYPFNVGDPFGNLLTDSYTSYLYNNPFQISDRSSEPDKLANKNSRQNPLYVPPVPVRKATVVRAKAYIDGIPTPTVSRTYFVWPSGNPFNIPVISIQIPEHYMFDYNIGIYTAGVDFDTWRTNNPDNTQGYRPEWSNYWRSGSAWEYPVNIEFFDATNLYSVMNSNGGLRIHGNNSRAHGIKSLRLYAKSSYSESGMFEHPLMTESIPDASVVGNQQFKRMMLRGDGSGGSVANDVVFNRLMQPVFNGITRIRPAIHFINGEYFGLTAIRDRFDQHHYALNFNLDPDNVSLIDCKGDLCELDEGSDADYQDFITLRDFIINNDMSVQELYEQAKNQLDMTSFIDHIIIEIFSGNNSYERKFWRSNTPENDSYGDGKWRVNVQDFEASFNSAQSTIGFWTGPIVMQSPNESLFGHLMENLEFKNQFINRFADLLNTAFVPERSIEITNTTFDEVTPYLAEDTNRFPRNYYYGNTEKQNLLNWVDDRPNEVREDIKSYFSITNTINLNLNISDNQAGYIDLNTISVHPQTVGVPENAYPWSGVYFKGIPVVLKAKAYEGYQFTHWSGDVSGTSETITFTPDDNMQIQANYQYIGMPADVIYFWMMDSNIPNDTPLESLASTYSANNQEALITYSSSLEGYPFYDGHEFWRKASMERRNAPTSLNYYPQANNDIPYSDGIMRGIQIKQPFKSGNSENTLFLNCSTINLNEVKLSFATESDGAADQIIVDYWNGTNWSQDNLPNAVQSISTTYQVMEFDFTNVSSANNNSEFKIRLRFNGQDMFADNGKRVHFNNIAILAKENLSVNEEYINVNSLVVYPNPTSDAIALFSDGTINEVLIYNTFGQIVYKQNNVDSNKMIYLQDLPSGIYILKAKVNNKERIVKVVKR